MANGTHTHIIEDSANRFWKVRPHDFPELSHCYLGIEVKRTKGGFSPRAGRFGSTEQLVRREATRIIAALN